MKKMKILVKKIIKNLKKNDGFTMVELIIVVAIIAILATIGITNYSKIFDNQKVKITKTKISELESNLDRYNLEYDEFPSQEDGLQALIEKNIIQNKKGVLEDPWKMPFNYKYPSEVENVDFQIWSYGADKKEGGTGVNADINNWD